MTLPSMPAIPSMPSKATLSKFWDAYKPQLIGGLAGAGLGAASLGGVSALSNEPDEETRSNDMKRNLLLGGVLGGVGGVGLGTAYQHANQPGGGAGWLGRLLNRAEGSRALAGAGIATAGHAAVSQAQNAGSTVLGKTIFGKGGTQGGKSIDELQTKLKELIDLHSKPNGAAPAEILSAGRQNDIRSIIDRMTANQSTLGQWSQKPLIRRLGLNVATGESAVADALRSLRGKMFDGGAGRTSGEDVIKQLLQQRANPGTTAFPFIQQDVLENQPAGAVIRNSRLKSLLGRASVGALAYPAAHKINELSKPSY